MNNLGSSIAELFSVLRRMATEEYRGIRNTLLYLLLTFYGLCLLQLLLNGGWFVKIASFIFWVGGVLLLFRVPSLIKIAGFGEILELIRLTQKVPETENQVPKAIENQLSVLVWNLSEKLLFLLTTCCFIIPTYPIRNNPWIIAIFTMAAAIVFLFIWRSKSDWVRPIGLTVSLIFLAINVFSSFPQLSYYTGIEKWIGGIASAETAGVANKTDQLRNKQRDEMLKKAYEKSLDWQKQNPGRDLPENLKKEIEAAKLGLAISEYEEKLKAETEAKVRAKAEAKAEIEAKAKAEASKSPANISAVSAAPIEVWKLCWQKPEGYVGNSDLRGLSGTMEIQKNKDSLLATFYPENGNNATFKGVSLDEKKYQGIWKDKFYGGEFSLNFLSENSATGYCTDNGSTVQISMLMTKI